MHFLQFRPQAHQKLWNKSNLLQGPWWPSGQNRYNTVINIGLVMIISSTIAQSWLMGSQKAVKKYMRTTFLLKVLGWQREKEGMREIQKFEYLENKKLSQLLDEIKSIFISFLRDTIYWSRKIADTSFNDSMNQL